MASDDEKYSVGWGKPPRDTRFKKGQSGNPKGRPKGSKNFATVLAKILKTRVPANVNGRRCLIPKLDVAITQLANKRRRATYARSRYCLMKSARSKVTMRYIPRRRLKRQNAHVNSRLRNNWSGRLRSREYSAIWASSKSFLGSRRKLERNETPAH